MSASDVEEQGYTGYPVRLTKSEAQVLIGLLCDSCSVGDPALESLLEKLRCVL